MLNVMRRSANTWIIKMLLVLIALSFVVWGVGDYDSSGAMTPVAEGGGWTIGPREFSVAYDNEFNRMKQRFGGQLDKKTADMLGLKQLALDGLIHRHLLLEAGRDLNLAVSPTMLRHHIATYPAFQVGGTFDEERYRLLLRNNRMAPRQFEDQLATDMITNQVQNTLAQAVSPPQVLLEDVYRMEHEKRVVDLLTLKPKALEEDIELTDEALATFFQQYTDRFMTEAQVKVTYVVLDIAGIKPSLTLSPDAIKQHYDENRAMFQREERRDVSHILAREAKKAGPPDAATEKSALERIRGAQARLNAGETFAAVAQAVSDDVSKFKGGSLGTFARGVMAKAFEEVAFTLPVGQVSEPVKTPFGYHLIRVNAIHAGETQTLEEVSDEIRARLLEQKAMDVVYERATTLEDQLFSSGNLKVIAEDLGLAYRETDLFSRAHHDALEETVQNDLFLNAAFSVALNDVSDLLELKEGCFVALHVVEKKDPEPKALESVRENVVALYKSEKAHERAQQLMAQALKQVQDGKSWEEAEALHPAIQARISEPFSRRGGGTTPSPMVRTASFTVHPAQPLHPEVLKGLDELVLLRLKEVQDAAPEGLEGALKTLRPTLQQTLDREHMATFFEGLRRAANVEVHDDVLERF